MNANHVLRAALVGAMALGLSAGTAVAAKGDFEKCAGIVKAGKNDCGTSQGACAGSVSVDADSEAWIYVPRGTCEKIVGGMVTDKPENRHGGAAG